jgi:alpha-1,6-mannosyltransferase
MTPWLTAGSVLLALMVLFSQVGDWLTTTYLAAGIVFVVTMWWSRNTESSRGLLAWIVMAGLAMRAVCFTGPPRHETDFYRYLWEGALVAHGHNPYTVRPKDVPADDKLAEAGQSVLERVNHSYLPSIYPPVAQAAFALAYRIAPFNANALRAVFLGFDLAVLAMLVLVLRRLGKPAHQAAIYWWNPIVVKEFYVAAHMDAVVVALATLAVMAAIWQWRRIAPVLLGFAVGAKLWPVVFAPILLRRQRQWVTGALLFGATATLVLWPMLSVAAGWNAYAEHWTNNAGAFNVIRWAAHLLRERQLIDWYAAENLARLVTGALLVAWLGILTRRPIAGDEDFVRRCLFAVGGLFLLSPTQFPWYYTWLLPFLAVTPSLPLLLYTALLPLYHLHGEHKRVLWIEHLPVWLLILAGGVRRCHQKQPSRHGSGLVNTPL